MANAKTFPHTLDFVRVNQLVAQIKPRRHRDGHGVARHLKLKRARSDHVGFAISWRKDNRCCLISGSYPLGDEIDRLANLRAA
jgi:hypothetical protein